MKTFDKNSRFIQLLVTFLIFAAAGLISSIGRTLPEDKLNRVVLYLLKTAENSLGQAAHEITQQELQETLRFAHFDKMSAKDLFDAKITIRELHRFQNLSTEDQRDILNILQDMIEVTLKMNEQREHGLWCHFNLGNDPWNEVPNRSFIKNPEQFRGEISDKEIEMAIKGRNLRTIIAQCWQKKQNDPLVRIGYLKN